jgi:hypothetical protein
MASMLCVACTVGDDVVEFPSVAEYIAHEKGGHISRPKKDLPPSPPVTPSATELKAMAEQVQTAPPSQGGSLEHGTNPSPSIKPLYITYRWIGVHPPCNTEVKTIEVDVDDKSLLVAYCMHCDLKLEQARLIPVKAQLNGTPRNKPKSFQAVTQLTEK